MREDEGENDDADGEDDDDDNVENFRLPSPINRQMQEISTYQQPSHQINGDDEEEEDEEMEDVSNVPEGSNSEEMMPSRNQTLSEETVFSGLAASTSGSGTGTEREHHHRPEIHSHHDPRSHHDSRSHHNPHSRPSAIKEAPGRDDPYELRLRGGRTLSDERFIQRTEVFEKLLKLVNPGDEEPEARWVDGLGSLW